MSDAAAWFAPREPGAPRGSLALRLRRRARHLLRQDRKAMEQAVGQAQELMTRLAPLDGAAFAQRVAQTRLAFRRARADRSAGAPELTEALAVAAQAAQRTVGLTASIPQLMAALAMADGYTVQLAPGEGKTLAVAMAAILQAWDARPCHVVTANDYLAARDAKLMQGLFTLCGCSAASVTQELPREQVGPAYACDIVYATAPQLLADFLRDQLLLGGAQSPVQRRLWRLRGGAGGQPVMRGLYSAIIDEADGVLIDEATTPLIIASPQSNPLMVRATCAARELVEQMERDRHYRVHVQEGQDVRLTPEGEDWLDEVAGELPEFWQTPDRRENLICMALLARDVFQRDRHYVVQQGRVVIVDENTGRLMPDRSWSHGIHQAIEAREGLELTDPSQTAARMTFQDFFRRYHVLSGASGTLQGIAGELWSTFGLLTLRLAPRVPSRLRTGERHVFRDREGKLAALVQEVGRLHGEGLPVLVGTRRILDSEAIAERLAEAGVDCEVLNAKKHAEEAEIVARAGATGCVTVATNMAGRGVDIAVDAGSIEAGGLHVILSERHDAGRIDRQLEGRTARRGEPGSTEAILSLEDPLLELAPRGPVRWFAGSSKGFRQWCARQLFAIAQRRAEQSHARDRRSVLAQDRRLGTLLAFSGAME